VFSASKYTTFPLKEQEAGRRLDSLLKQFLKNLSASSLYKAFRKGDIRLNGQKVEPSTLTQRGDILFIYTPLLSSGVSASNLPLKKIDFNPDVVWRDKNFLVINKPFGWLVTPSTDKLEPSLKDWVLSYLKEVYQDSLVFKPAPLHRLDRNTTGLLVFSASLWGAQTFSQALREHHLKKTYLALVEGETPLKFYWEDSLVRDREGHKSFSGNSPEAKIARTAGRTIASYRGRSLVELVIETGVTHQIRASASFHGFPLVGDTKYGARSGKTGYYLHAYSLIFPQELKVPPLKAPIPEAFWKELEGWNLRGEFKKGDRS
jgi:23S rRNA pseudouridine955/2504/2580 synthase